MPYAVNSIQTDLAKANVTAAMARSNLPSLLLLPSPPSPATRASLGAAYRPPLEMALAKTRDAGRLATLFVAVAVPFVRGPSQESKQFSWPDAQALLAGLYTIIAELCETLQIGTEVDGGPGAVDARVVLLDHDRDRMFPDFLPIVEPNNTVLVDLRSFAAAYHPWNRIFHVQSEAGLHLHNLYLKFAQTAQRLADDQLVAVAGGLTMHVATAPVASSDETSGAVAAAPTKLHKTVCLGGTFDHLHPGHKLLLTAGALLLDVPTPLSDAPCEYVIGVTGDALLVNKKYAAFVQPWDERARGVLDFLTSILDLSRDGWEEKIGPEIREADGDFRATFRNGAIVVQCVRLHNPFGPTIERADISCLVVSGETRSGGQAVNDRRAALGWPPLETFEVDVLSADDGAAADGFGAKISSSAIRKQRAEAAEAAARG